MYSQRENDTCDDNGLVTVTSTDSLNLHTEELREVPENSISSLNVFPQEQCFVIFKRYTLQSAGQDNSWHSRTKFTRTSGHLLWFWPKEKDNFIVAFTISPFYHGSKMLPNVQYTDARSPLFFIIIHLLYGVACVAVSNLLVFLHKSNPSSCLAAIVS